MSRADHINEGDRLDPWGQMVESLGRRADPATRSPSWPGVLAAINTDPRPFARALGLLAVTPRAGRTFH